MGYFNIGDTDAATGINLLELPAETWAVADEQIDQVIRDIRDRRFEPAAVPPMYDGL